MPQLKVGPAICKTFLLSPTHGKPPPPRNSASEPGPAEGLKHALLSLYLKAQLTFLH